LGRRKSGLSWCLTGLYCLGLTAWFYFLWRGFDYYTTGYDLRPHHGDYRMFRPAGNLGLIFGILGTLMMVGLLLYVVRKRTRLFGRVFALSSWLAVHIFFGILGPLFILLHTSFKLNGLVAISFWAMVAVAMSGVFGRYLYVQIPRNIRGDKLTLKQMEDQDREMTARLVDDFDLDPQRLEALLERLGNKSKDSLVSMILGDLARPLVWSRLRRQLLVEFKLPQSDAARLLDLAKRKAKLSRRMARLDRILSLFHYWHIVHRPFAAVMYLFMAIHIVVALLFGISWKSG